MLRNSPNSTPEPETAPVWPQAELQPPLGEYSEQDDAPTRFVEAPAPDPPWLVQITPFDRRRMSTERLLQELERGERVGRDTLVWRQGAGDWRAIAVIDELKTSEPPWPAMPSGKRSRFRPVWLASAAAVVASAAVVHALFVAGAFQPGLPASAAVRPPPVPGKDTARAVPPRNGP